MADLATTDPHGAAWERRLLAPVIAAAVAVLALLGKSVKPLRRSATRLAPCGGT